MRTKPTASEDSDMTSEIDLFPVLTSFFQMAVDANNALANVVHEPSVQLWIGPLLLDAVLDVRFPANGAFVGASFDFFERARSYWGH
jgi:hypothetical protein